MDLEIEKIKLMGLLKERRGEERRRMGIGSLLS